MWGFVLLGMVSPVRYLGELGFKDHAQMNVAERRIAENPQPWIEGDFQRIIQSMNDCPACRGMTWSTPSLSTWIAINTGLPMVQMRRTTRTMPLNRRLIFQSDQELTILATVPTLDLLESLRVRWVVFSCGEFNGLPKVVQSFIQSLPEKIGAKDLSAPGSPRDCYKAYLLPESN